MRFYSPNPGLRVICSVQRQKFHSVTGDVIETLPGITAEFAKFGAPYEYMDPLTGATATGADISGHYFDTDLEAAQNDWSQDEKEMVERKLLGLCKREPTRIQMIASEVVKAALPWPTYDALDADQAVALASQLGLVAEALAYERENRDRPAVVDALSASVDAEAESADEAPVRGAKIDPEKLAALTGGKTITV